jgi:arsenate reductase (glutaredoxin)
MSGVSDENQFPVVVHHNPGCGTSRQVLGLVEAAGYRPTIVEYLKTGWTRAQLLGLFAAAGLTPHEALRTARSPAEELGLLDPEIDDETLLAAMIEHPELTLSSSTGRSCARRRASGCAARRSACWSCSSERPTRPE